MGRQQILILVIAVISAFLGFAFLSGQFNSGPKVVGGVAIAETDIEPNTFIQLEQVTSGSVDTAIFPPNMLLPPDQAIGRIPRAKINQGEPITSAVLYSGTAGLPYVLPPGMRAMSVPINQPEEELKLFKPGCRIDVLATIQERSGYFRTGTILEDVLLLAKEQSDPSRAEKRISFVMAVDPKGAEKIALAVGHGEVRVVLRQEDDQSIMESTGVSLSELIKGMDVDEASGAVDTFEPGSMEIIRGTLKVTETFGDSSDNSSIHAFGRDDN